MRWLRLSVTVINLRDKSFQPDRLASAGISLSLLGHETRNCGLDGTMRKLALKLAPFALILLATPANAVSTEQSRDARCITVSDVVILAGEETWANKRLCKSPGSARYDVVEVTDAVYGAATTRAALEKAGDPRLVAMRQAIEEMRVKFRSRKDEAETDYLALVRAQQKFMAALATKDRAYSEAIAQFRGAVVDIASTQEGLTALARYNAGDEVGALAILDRMNAANDSARKIRSDIESASERRRIASLALDARSKGKVSTSDLIERYRTITRLDPEISDDWIVLARLFEDSGNLTEAHVAAQRSLETAQSNRDKVRALSELSLILEHKGATAEAFGYMQKSYIIARQSLEADPQDFLAKSALAATLNGVSSFYQSKGNFSEAEKSLRESLGIRRNLASIDPSNIEMQRMIEFTLANLGELRSLQNDWAEAEKLNTEILSLSRRLVREN